MQPVILAYCNAVANQITSRLMAVQKQSLVPYLLCTAKYRVTLLYTTTFFQSYGPSAVSGWFNIFPQVTPER